MSKVNYNEISRRPIPQVNNEPAKPADPEVKKPELNDQEAPEVPATPVATVTPDTTNEPEVSEEKSVIKGTVVNCAKLNIRKAPCVTSQILCTVDVNTEVSIDLDDSTNAWYNVYVNDSILGYCMKNYIAIKD